MGRTITVSFPDQELLGIAGSYFSRLTGKPVTKVTESELVRFAMIEYTATLKALVDVKAPPSRWQELWGRARIYFSKEGFAKTIDWPETKKIWTETRAWNATIKEVGRLSKEEREKFQERRADALQELQERETKMMLADDIAAGEEGGASPTAAVTAASERA